MNSAGYPFTMTPSGSGYNVDTSDDGASFLGSIFGSKSQSATPPAAAADSPMMGNGTYPDGAAGGTAQTDSSVNGNGSIAAFMKEYGADAAAIIVGVIIVGAAIWKIA